MYIHQKYIYESDFPILDLLSRTKPNASMQTLLSLMMWARNHILE